LLGWLALQVASYVYNHTDEGIANTLLGGVSGTIVVVFASAVIAFVVIVVFTIYLFCFIFAGLLFYGMLLGKD